MTEVKMASTGDDCYFYYYSTCTKVSLGAEVVYTHLVFLLGCIKITTDSASAKLMLNYRRQCNQEVKAWAMVLSSLVVEISTSSVLMAVVISTSYTPNLGSDIIGLMLPVSGSLFDLKSVTYMRRYMVLVVAL